jgi:hypothetical protein
MLSVSRQADANSGYVRHNQKSRVQVAHAFYANP